MDERRVVQDVFLTMATTAATDVLLLQLRTRNCCFIRGSGWTLHAGTVATAIVPSRIRKAFSPLTRIEAMANVLY